VTTAYGACVRSLCPGGGTAAAYRDCSATWWAPRSSLASSTLKTCAWSSVPTRRPLPRSSSTTKVISPNTLAMGYLVYFGYPTAHEDDARRAVYTGLGIVEAIAILNTVWRYSTVSTSPCGSASTPAPSWWGDGGWRAARASGARGNTQHCSTARRSRPGQRGGRQRRDGAPGAGAFVLEDLGTHALHGVAEPMALSRVRGLLATSSRDEEFVTAGVPLLVGRRRKRAAAPPLGAKQSRIGPGRLHQR